MMNLWKIRNIANMIFIIALVFTFIFIYTSPRELHDKVMRRKK